MEPEKTITINGRTLIVRPGMIASELKQLAGIALDRVIIARNQHGDMQIVPNHHPLPGPVVIDAPRFIYG